MFSAWKIQSSFLTDRQKKFLLNTRTIFTIDSLGIMVHLLRHYKIACFSVACTAKLFQIFWQR